MSEITFLKKKNENDKIKCANAFRRCSMVSRNHVESTYESLTGGLIKHIGTFYFNILIFLEAI